MWGLPQPLIPLWSSGLDFGRAIFFDYVDGTNVPRLAAGGFGKSIRRQRGRATERETKSTAKQRAARYFPCIAFSRICASRYEEPGWVAHSGLDPVHHQSGSSVHKPSRISRAAIPTTEPASCPSSRSRPVPTLPRERFSTPLQRDKYLDPQERIFATNALRLCSGQAPSGPPSGLLWATRLPDPLRKHELHCHEERQVREGRHLDFGAVLSYQD